MRASAPLRRSRRLVALPRALAAAAALGILLQLVCATPALASVPASGAFLAFLTQQATRAQHGRFAASLAGALGLGVAVGAVVVLCFGLAAGARRR